MSLALKGYLDKSHYYNPPSELEDNSRNKKYLSYANQIKSLNSSKLQTSIIPQQRIHSPNQRLNEVSSKLSDIKTKLSKICYPQKASFFNRVPLYNNNQQPAQKIFDNKLLDYQYQKSKQQLDLYRNQPTILKSTFLHPPQDYAYYSQKNSIANQNEQTRMQYLLSRIDRLEQENSQLYEKSLQHEQIINQFQRKSSLQLNNSIIQRQLNHSIAEPNQIKKLQQQADYMLEETQKLANMKTPSQEYYDQSKLLNTISRIKTNLVKTSQCPQNNNSLKISPKKYRYERSHSPYNFLSKKTKKFCPNCAKLLSKGLSTTQCHHHFW